MGPPERLPPGCRGRPGGSAPAGPRPRAAAPGGASAVCARPCGSPARPFLAGPVPVPAWALLRPGSGRARAAACGLACRARCAPVARVRASPPPPSLRLGGGAAWGPFAPRLAPPVAAVGLRSGARPAGLCGLAPLALSGWALRPSAPGSRPCGSPQPGPWPLRGHGCALAPPARGRLWRPGGRLERAAAPGVGLWSCGGSTAVSLCNLWLIIDVQTGNGIKWGSRTYVLHKIGQKRSVSS